MRALGFAAFAATFALAGSAWAANPLPFDPELATHAWLATLGPEATARSNSYFEGGYLIDFAGTALSIGVSVGFGVANAQRDIRNNNLPSTF